VKSCDEGGKNRTEVERRGNTGGKESREEENVAMKDGKEIGRKKNMIFDKNRAESAPVGLCGFEPLNLFQASGFAGGF
jgi:hypothetical protein